MEELGVSDLIAMVRALQSEMNSMREMYEARIKELETENAALKARVADLALLAQRLPKTLHVHPDLRLTDGKLYLRCQSQVKDGGLVWQGKLHTSDIHGIKGKQSIAWAERHARNDEI